VRSLRRYGHTLGTLGDIAGPVEEVAGFDRLDAVSGREGAIRMQSARMVASSSVPISLARSVMSVLSIASSGRWIGSVVAALVTARFRAVWPDIWPTDSPVTMPNALGNVLRGTVHEPSDDEQPLVVDALDERLDRVEAIIEQLESGDPSREEGERLFEEGRQTLDEIREILDRGEGEVVELPE